jgi:hypothetical protein
VRRAATAPALRLDPAAAGAWARLHAGPRGLGLAADDPPEGVELAAGPPLRPVRGAPSPAHEAALAAGGGLALTAATGVARSLRLPDVAVVHDRRPPGLARVAAAARANAGLLLAEDGWRAVVLPSLGDLAAGLGPGPVAIRPDGRRVAALRDGAIEEIDLPEGRLAGRHDPGPDPPGALAYAADGRLVCAAGAAVGAPPPAAGREGSAVVALAAAAEAPLALARHADGAASLWDLEAGGRIGAWPGPLAGPASISLSADGESAVLATPFASPAAACVVRTRDGALVRRIAEARAAALAPDGVQLLIGGDWGLMWLAPPLEDG